MAFRVSSSGIKLSGRDGDQTLNGSDVLRLSRLSRLLYLMTMLTESDPDCSEPLKNAAEQSEMAWMMRGSSDVHARSEVISMRSPNRL